MNNKESLFESSYDNDLFTIVSHINGPLPIFHPQFLVHCVLAGKMDSVHKILTSLYCILRDAEKKGNPAGLRSSLEFSPMALVTAQKIVRKLIKEY